VTIQYDWGSFNGGPAGALGCPNPSGVGVGFPIAIQVTCNNGAAIVLEAHYFEGQAAYLMDTAHPADGIPPSPSFGNAPSLTSVAGTTFCTNAPVPSVFSDCDDTSLGFNTTCFSPTDKVPTGRGRMYTKNAPCQTSPDPRLSTGWVKLPTDPDANGNACNTVPSPATGCTYVGNTITVGGLESSAIAGSFQVPPQGAATDKVKIDKALFSQGKLIVNFSTINETSIVGFNVYAGTSKLNANLIQAAGTGSNAYPFEADRSAAASNKTVSVEVVMKDGSVQKVGPVSVEKERPASVK
jgi:hypothetical protein